MKKIAIGLGTIIATTAPIAAVVSCSSKGEPSYLLGSDSYELRIPTTPGKAAANANDAQKAAWNKLLQNLKEESKDGLKVTYNVETTTTDPAATFAKGEKVVITTLDYEEDEGVVHFANLTRGTDNTVLLEFWKEPRKDC